MACTVTLPRSQLLKSNQISRRSSFFLVRRLLGCWDSSDDTSERCRVPSFLLKSHYSNNIDNSNNSSDSNNSKNNSNDNNSNNSSDKNNRTATATTTAAKTAMTAKTTTKRQQQQQGQQHIKEQWRPDSDSQIAVNLSQSCNLSSVSRALTVH